MNEIMAGAVVETSLDSARRRSNAGYRSDGFMEWLEGRCQAINACADVGSPLLLDALAAMNEVRFLRDDYMRRHAK